MVIGRNLRGWIGILGLLPAFLFHFYKQLEHISSLMGTDKNFFLGSYYQIRGEKSFANIH